MTRCRACRQPICGCPDPAYQGVVPPHEVVSDLRRAAALFQQRAIVAHIRGSVT